jgi:hypothetical protein
MPMIWGIGDKHSGCACAACGKEIKMARWGAHVIDGGANVLHPDDEDKYEPDAGEMGLHYLGSECRRKFGAFAVRLSGNKP